MNIILDRVKEENNTERDNHSYEAAHTYHVSADFPPYINDETNNLSNYGRKNNSPEKCPRASLIEQ